MRRAGRDRVLRSAAASPRPDPSAGPLNFLRGALGSQGLLRTVSRPVQERENHALAQAPLADLKGLTQKLGELLQQEHTGRQDPDPARVELEALRDVGD